MNNPMSRWALAAVLTVLTFAACVAVAEAQGTTAVASQGHAHVAVVSSRV